MDETAHGILDALMGSYCLGGDEVNMENVDVQAAITLIGSLDRAEFNELCRAVQVLAPLLEESLAERQRNRRR